jgi:hypothetical protein
MDGNLPQKTVKKAGGADTGVFVKNRIKRLAGMEKKGGNFTVSSAQVPYMAAAFPDTNKTGAGGNAEFFPGPKKSFRPAVFGPGKLPPAGRLNSGLPIHA